MAAGANTLTVADASGFSVGDWVIVATGGEVGGGTRGTGLGVGGAWPALSYADATEMNADTSQADLTCCWLEDSGDVRYWNTGTSTWVTPAATEYYASKVVPKALWAEITDKSGNVLTLSETASASTTGAAVYFDNWCLIQPELTAGRCITLPSGTFAVSDYLQSQSTGISLYGQGPSRTTLLTPRGASMGGISLANGDFCTVAELSLDLGFKNDTYSFRWANGRTHVLNSFPPGQAWPETWRGTGPNWGHGVKFATLANGVARNVWVVDAPQQAVAASFCEDVWAYNCKAVLTTALQQYIQWFFQWADSGGGGCVECEIDSPYLVAGFEPFKSTGVSFIRCTARNAPSAINSSDDTLFEEHNMIIEEGSATASWSSSNPLFNLNTNTSGGFNTLQNSFVNINVVVEGYPDPSSPWRPIVINLSGSTPPVLVSGTYDTDVVSPKGLIDMRPAATATGGRGINADGAGTNVTVEGIRIKGDPPTGGTSMISSGGTLSVTNSIFDDTSPDGGGSFTLSGNQTNAEYEA